MHYFSKNKTNKKNCIHSDFEGGFTKLVFWQNSLQRPSKLCSLLRETAAMLFRRTTRPDHILPFLAIMQVSSQPQPRMLCNTGCSQKQYMKLDLIQNRHCFVLVYKLVKQTLFLMLLHVYGKVQVQFPQMSHQACFRILCHRWHTDYI